MNQTISGTPAPNRILPRWTWALGVACFALQIVDALLYIRATPAATLPMSYARVAFALGPWAIALVALWVPASRPLAYGVVAAGAGRLALPQLPVLIVGIATGSVGVIALSLTFGLMHLGVVVGALAAAARSASRVMVAVGFVSTLAALPLYAYVGESSVSAIDRRLIAERIAAERMEPGNRAGHVVSLVATCLHPQLSDGPPPPWPRTVDDLGPGGARCLTADQLRPADKAYEIQVSRSPEPEHAPAFAACVSLPRAGGGFTAWVVDEDGRGHGSGSAGQRTAACAQAYRDRLRQLRFCLWHLAAGHDGRYPPTLEPLSEGCLPPEKTAVEGLARRYTYMPGPYGPDGQSSTFTLIESPTAPGPRFLRRRLDQSGTIRATREDRIPTAHDPIDDRRQDRRLWSSWHEPRAAALLEARCHEGGDVECVAVAQALEEHAEQSRKIAAHDGKADSAEGVSAPDGAPGDADLARALDLYRRACGAAVLDGCEYGLRLARTLPADAPNHIESRRLSARGCALGLDESCEALRTLGGPVPDSRPLEDQCGDGIGSACATAARRLDAQGRRIDALGLYERGCDLGNAEACLGASRLLGGHAGVPADQERAAGLRRLACSIVPGPAECDTP